MHTRHLASTTLLLGSFAILAPACIGTVDSPTDEGAGGANMTPAEPEPIGEARAAIGFCGCSTKSDYCWLTVGGVCTENFNNCIKTVKNGCGLGMVSPCNGECVRR
jgi:hypothetical protein